MFTEPNDLSARKICWYIDECRRQWHFITSTPTMHYAFRIIASIRELLWFCYIPLAAKARHVLSKWMDSCPHELALMSSDYSDNQPSLWHIRSYPMYFEQHHALDCILVQNVRHPHCKWVRTIKASLYRRWFVHRTPYFVWWLVMFCFAIWYIHKLLNPVTPSFHAIWRISITLQVSIH